MDNRTYLIQTANGQYSPPLTLDTLAGYARFGTIRPETFVYDQTASAWIPAHQIPELRAIFAGATQPSLSTFQTAVAVTQPRAPMSRGTKVALGLGVALALLLCGGGGFGMISLIKYGIDKPETFVSKDASFEITASQSWSERTDLNDEADLQIGDSMDDLYLIVLREPKSDFESDDLERYSAVSRQPMLDSLKNGAESDRQSLKINGYPAIRYQLEGTPYFLKVKYLHVSVATPTHFYQIMGWGTASDFERRRQELEKVIESFNERRAAQSGG